MQLEITCSISNKLYITGNCTSRFLLVFIDMDQHTFSLFVDLEINDIQALYSAMFKKNHRASLIYERYGCQTMLLSKCKYGVVLTSSHMDFFRDDTQ